MKLSVQIEIDKSLKLISKKDIALVGRSNESDMVIPHESVSRKHCKIEIINQEFFITDLGSSNGTFIEKTRLIPQKKTKFISGQELTIGKLYCELEYGTFRATASYHKPVNNPNASSATLKTSNLELSSPTLRHRSTTNFSKKRIKNPISEIKTHNEIKSIKKSKLHFIIYFILILIAQLYLIQKAKH